MAAQSSDTADLEYLKSAKLTVLESDEAVEEALGLSSIKEQLDAANVPLYGVVHEKLNAPEFREFLKGEIYLDTTKTFYGPKERWLNVAKGVLDTRFMKQAYNAKKAGVPGNMQGEGRLLGGVFVIGKGDRGIIFQHFETFFGDHAKLEDVSAAVKEIK